MEGRAACGFVDSRGALSQQWWPLKHDEHGTTVGSIDLGYKYASRLSDL